MATLCSLRNEGTEIRPANAAGTDTHGQAFSVRNRASNSSILRG
jgi:hypothetical protein